MRPQWGIAHGGEIICIWAESTSFAGTYNLFKLFHVVELWNYVFGQKSNFVIYGRHIFTLEAKEQYYVLAGMDG